MGFRRQIVKIWVSIFRGGLPFLAASDNAITISAPMLVASDTSETGMSYFENEDQIVPLWKAQATARSKICVDVLEYWTSLRDGKKLPKQSQLSPNGLKSALSYVFMLERIAPGIARIRVAGAHMNDLMGMEVKAMPITAFAAPGERSSFLPLVDAVFEDPAIVELDLVATRAGYTPKEAEMLLMPIEDEHGRISRALGCLVARGPIVFSPYRFRIQSQRVMALTATTPLIDRRRRDTTPAARPTGPDTAFEAHFQQTNQRVAFRKTKVPYLQIVDTMDKNKSDVG